MHDLGPSRGKPGAYSARELAPPSTGPRSPERRRSRLGLWFDSWMRSLGMAFVLFLIIKTFLVEAFQIPSGSMERTLLVGDFLFVNKAAYGAQIPGTGARLPGYATPSRGDVVVFAYPKNPHQHYVKRVVGVPGDTIEMHGGDVRVNGDDLDEPYAQRTDSLHDLHSAEFNWQRDHLAALSLEAARRYNPTRDNWGPLVVPSGKFFVLGDNRDNSSDSRYWGFVDAAAIKGRPLVVYFSYDREAGEPLPWLTDIRWGRLGSVIR